MKGVTKWVGSQKKQKHLEENLKGKEACYCLENPEDQKDENTVLRRKGIRTSNDGLKTMALTKKQARPDSSGQGSMLLHQPVLISTGLMKLRSCLFRTCC
jgi:hypothetical protein